MSAERSRAPLPDVSGRFEQAKGGTLLLDEIGDLDLELQAKLLRVLQTGKCERVGGNETIQTDARVIASTHRDLAKWTKEGRFREDLFYRLSVVTLKLPPLRDRRDDIPILAEHFMRTLAQKYNWPQLAISPDAVQWLEAQSWVGNVRETAKCLGASGRDGARPVDPR